MRTVELAIRPDTRGYTKVKGGAKYGGVSVRTFRDWLNKIYGEYMLEIEYENTPSRLDLKEYFRRYKWWLRKQYREQCQKN